MPACLVTREGCVGFASMRTELAPRRVVRGGGYTADTGLANHVLRHVGSRCAAVPKPHRTYHAVQVWGKLNVLVRIRAHVQVKG